MFAMAQDSSNKTLDNKDAGGQPDDGIASLKDLATAELIRQKVARVYEDAPPVKDELVESEEVPHRSRHQQFMYDLGASGKSLATIQTDWHNYYQSLSEGDKHQVWQEFYASQSLITGNPQSPQKVAAHKHQAAKPQKSKSPKLREARSPEEIQQALLDKVTAGGKLEAKHHLQSLLFGLGMGLIVLVIFLFGFFNEVVIAPFIQPGRVVADTPLIISSNSVAPTANPEIIIPKINVEIPVDYAQTSTNENVIENALESGIVHYPNTAEPGQNGNAAFFGHSSNNIFNKGKYKFAFVLLHTLQNGDTFYLTKNGTVYVYKVIQREIVDPSDVGVLDPIAGQTATATLITCDPPGTSLHRLVVVGQQISPAVSTNSQPVAITSTATPASLPGNGPTLWGRLIATTAGKALVSAVIAAVILYAVRELNKKYTTDKSD